MKYMILLVLYVVAFSCNNRTGNQKCAVSDTIYVDSKGNRYKHFVQIPDSLYTPEQKELAIKLNEIILKYTKAKGNHMVWELTKEQYLKMGLPVRYYIILKKNIKDNNSVLDTFSAEHVEEMIRERNDDIYKELKKLKK